MLTHFFGHFYPFIHMPIISTLKLAQINASVELGEWYVIKYVHWMGQICQFSHFLPIFYLQCSQIFCYCTFSVPVGSQQLIEPILEKDFFFKNDIFCIFRPKNHKNGQKTFFYFEKWKFFWHTLIIWEDQHFSCFTLLIQSKK